MNLPIAILAGGLATRLRPMTEKTPKSLLEVAGKPFIAWQLELLRRNGFQSVVLCLGYLGERVQKVVSDGSSWGLSVRYAFDGERLLGTGGALKRALPFLGDAFFVMYGDSYLDCNFGAIEDAYVAMHKTGLMTVFRNDDRWDRSNVVFRDGHILAYDKQNRIPDMEHIDYGLGVLASRAFDAYADESTIDLATIYQDLLAKGDLAGFQVGQRFYEIGSPAGLDETRLYLAGKEKLS